MFGVREAKPDPGPPPAEGKRKEEGTEEDNVEVSEVVDCPVVEVRFLISTREIGDSGSAKTGKARRQEKMAGEVGCCSMLWMAHSF